MALITVAAAEDIIMSHAAGYGIEMLPFQLAKGRVLAADILADRSLPPYNRVTMDGIAIKYSSFITGIRQFRICATMAAGNEPPAIVDPSDCVELMTGCALPAATDTVIRYEDITISDGIATINLESLKQGANVHLEGADKLFGDVVVHAGAVIDAAVISMAASVGKHMLEVHKLPSVVVLSTGNELVDVQDEPGLYQVRRSNSYTIQAALKQYGIEAVLLHVNDELLATRKILQKCLNEYDVIMLSGGVSMGKFDFVPQALQESGVSQHFHKVMQRPGKPFWFGTHAASNTRIFAFPGNPVSAFLCLYRYFVPWLQQCMGILKLQRPVAMLGADVSFQPALQYFMQVSLALNDLGVLVAMPVTGNGSGDFSNLLQSNAFMELPADITNFRKGEVFAIWPFKQLF